MIVDEFAEPVTDDRGWEQLDRLVSVARTGAASGVHLLLAAQDPSGIVTTQIDSNTSLRMCFRVQTTAESREMIGIPDAGRIAPRHAGRGFKQTRPAVPVAFLSARVAGQRAGAQRGPSVSIREMLWDRLGHAPQVPTAPEVPDQDTDFWDLLQAIVDAAPARGSDGRARTLDEAAASSDHIRPSAAAGQPSSCHWVARRSRSAGAFSSLLELAAEHVGIAGSQGRGRTTALRAIVSALANRFPPTELHLYLLDFGGAGLRPLSRLPHCGGFADNDSEQAARIVDHCRASSPTGGVSSPRSVQRQSPSNGLQPDLPAPYVVVAIDGWDAFLEETQRTQVAEEFARLLGQSLSVGVQAIVRATPTLGGVALAGSSVGGSRWGS